MEVDAIHERTRDAVLVAADHAVGAGALADASLLAKDHHSSHTDRVALPFCHFRLTAEKPSSLAYPAELNTLGDHIRKRRLDLGLTQCEVAEKLGVTESTVWNWEASHSSPQLRFIPRIIAFLGYSPYDTESGTFSKRIIACRRVMGLTQKELARRLDIDPSTLGRWETGRGQPSKKHDESLEDFLRNLASVDREPQ